MSSTSRPSQGPLGLLVGIMATLLALSLGTALWLMDSPAPPVDPGAPAPATVPVVIPEAGPQEPQELPPKKPPAEAAPLDVTTEPEVFAPTRVAEILSLDIEEEIARLGVADVDPNARARVEGQVLDGANRPLPQAMVTLFDQRGNHITASFTDDDGGFHFESSVPLLAGWSVSTVVVPTLLPDDPTATAPASYSHPDDVRPGDEPVAVTLVVAPAPRLEGVVIDGTTGAPAQFAMVEVLSRSSAWQATSQIAFAEEDASFSVPLSQMPTANLLIRATDATGRQVIAGPLSLSPGQVHWIELTLAAPETISGQVTDALTGLTVPGARVTALPTHPLIDPVPQQTVCDGEGRFTLGGLSPASGRHRLHVVADDYGAEVVTVSDANLPLSVRLSPQVMLSGTIFDKASELHVRFASVTCVIPSMEGAGPSWADSTLCDESGRFELPLRIVPPSAAVLIVESPGHVLRRRALIDLVPVQLGSGEYELRIDLDRTHSR